VISSNGKGDRPVESLEVKAPVGRSDYRSDPYRGASNLAGRSECVNQVAPKFTSRVKRIAGSLGVPSRSIRGEGHADIAVLELTVIGFPGVVGDGMPGKNVQRKLGTTRGSPRRSRTAKASRISRHAAKSRCAREWGGWGRLSDDGPGHYNPDPSEGPWGRWSIPPHGGAVIASTDPTLCGSTLKHEGRRQTDRRAAYAGSRLKLIYASERSRLICQPFSRNGENSPYGMLGGIVETSASFEARSAPRSYPTHRAGKKLWLRCLQLSA